MTAGTTAIMRVETVAVSDTEVTRIIAVVGFTETASSATDQIARSFLGFVATVPYQDADPNAARQWVEAHVASSESSKTTFGGAEFSGGRSTVLNSLFYSLELRSLGFGSE